MGLVTNQMGQYDVAALKVSSSPLVYTGAYTSSTSQQVAGVVRPSDNLGEPVCTSGAFSGTRCNGASIDSYSHYGYWCTDPPGSACFSDLILWSTQQDIHDPELAGHGDSGGPVYLDPTYLSGYLFAVGLVHGPAGNSASCVGIAGAPCTNGITFSDVYTDASDWSLSLTE